MKAVRIHEYGGLDVLRFEEAPTPSIGPEDVLVRVKAAAVNPLDWKIREGHLRTVLPYRLPLILGWDVAGVVEDVGAAVTRFRPGDEVYSRPDVMRDGAYAEAIAVRAVEAAAKPKKASFQQAAAMPLTALTAWLALHDEAQIRAGTRVLIHGGAGSVGSFAIQLAKHAGAHVFATASREKQSVLAELGVDEPIDYTAADFASVARGVDVVIDTIGGDTQRRSWACLEPGGILVAMGTPPDATLAAQHRARGVLVRVQPNGSRLEKLAELFDEGILKVLVGPRFELAAVREAHRVCESGHAHGKVVLDVS